MTVGELRKALEGLPDQAPVMISLHDLEDVDEIVEIIGTEVFGAELGPDETWIEVYHAYSIPSKD